MVKSLKKEIEKLNEITLKKIKDKYGVELDKDDLEEIESIPGFITTLREKYDIGSSRDRYDDVIPVSNKIFEILFQDDLYSDYNPDNSIY